jgi:hypothetical protein
MILTTTRLSMNGLSQNTNPQTQTRTSYPSQVAVVSQRPSSLMVLLRKQQDLGTSFPSTYYQQMLIGEIWTVKTTCLGIRTNIFLVIAGPAGHRAQQVH